MVKELTRKMKDSGVEWIGEIPEDWEVSKYKRFTTNGMGSTILKEDLINSGIPVYSATKDSLVFGYLENPKIKLEKGDFIIPARGNSIGYVYMIKDKLATCTQTTIYSKINNDINKKYLLYQSKGLKDYWFEFDNTAIPQITVEQVANNRVLVPSMSEQNSIADFLDEKTQEIDNIISKTKKAIEEYKKYKQSLITETVTKGLDKNVQMKDSEIEWIGEIPEHWGLERLKYSFLEHKSKNIGNKEKNVLSLSYGNIVKRNIKDNFGLLPESFESYNIVKPGVIVLRLTDLQNDKKSWRVGISKQIGIITSAYVSLLNKDKNNRYSPYYYYFIHSLDYKKVFYNLGDGVRQSMSYMDIGNIEIVIPPLKEQKQIANYLDNKCSQIDQIISTKEKLLREIEAYKKSLIYETVTGKREVE